MKKDDEIRWQVVKRYGTIARSGAGCGCAPTAGSSCCGGGPARVDAQAQKIGYSEAEVKSVPAGANLGLGCGNPGAIAALQPGEVVLDLGAGGGFDCFLAAEKVSPSGRVIGVDMTPEMVARARENAARDGFKNVEFRLGEIEHLPVADASVDVIISNCVVNLSPDKPQAYREAFRVLKPGGRIAISDTVRLKEFPQEWKDNGELLCSCVTGSASPAEIKEMLKRAGFERIEVRIKEESREAIKDWAPGSGVEEFVASADIVAVKPLAKPDGAKT
jgi:SAM-dependent methyltransferase